MTDEPEIWKTLPENPSYSVSNMGRIIGPRSIITPVISERGYLRISLKIGGKKCIRHVHKLVCGLFNGTAPPDKPLALHKNHVKTDCRATNLYWGTHLENMADREAAGRTYRRLTAEQVIEIRRRYSEGETQSALGREFGVTQQYIGKLVKQKTWKVLSHDTSSCNP